MGAVAEARFKHFKHSEDWRWFWVLIAEPVGLALGVATNLKVGTVRVRVEGPGAGYVGPAVYVNWHGHIPFLAPHHGREHRWLMVSPAPYLEPIVRWCRSMGVRVVRGTSGERGREALAELLLHLCQGESAFLAVDGPAGPPFQVKRGCIDLARAAQVPLIPVAYCAQRGRPNPRRWDHWQRFKLFDRVTVRYGDPIHLDAAESDADALRRVQESLRQVAADVAASFTVAASPTPGAPARTPPDAGSRPKS